MKIFIDCECELIQASLEKFLAEFISSKYDADFIICDSLLLSDKPTFIIGTDIMLPFTSAQLKAGLNEFMRKHTPDTKDFERQLEEIFSRLKTDLIQLFKNAR